VQKLTFLRPCGLFSGLNLQFKVVVLVFFSILCYFTF